jgi:hypothetical protein
MRNCQLILLIPALIIKKRMATRGMTQEKASRIVRI